MNQGCANGHHAALSSIIALEFVSWNVPHPNLHCRQSAIIGCLGPQCIAKIYFITIVHWLSLMWLRVGSVGIELSFSTICKQIIVPGWHGQPLPKPHPKSQ